MYANSKLKKFQEIKAREKNKAIESNKKIAKFKAMKEEILTNNTSLSAEQVNAIALAALKA